MPKKQRAPVFHKAHYNILATRIRENIAAHLHTGTGISDPGVNIGARNALIDLAIDLARRFKVDNPSFDPKFWLDQCSPEPDIYPLSELWDDN